jgi:glutathione synthase/RimK-type ligase-like ATP-grasp enzyme
MTDTNVYIWYSGATDLTGKNLMTALDVEGGTSKPSGRTVIIGWGTKIKKDIGSLGKNAKVLNHPDQIRANRNKFQALQLMRAAGNTPVADFYTVDEVNGHMDQLPLVARRNFHQGGKGFWLCLTADHVRRAVNEGAQYFQKYIPIKDEFRLHIFDKKCIYAAKKVERDNMKEAFIEQQKEKAKNAAERKGMEIDENTLNFLLDRISKEQQEHPDHIVKSNTRGWKFSKVKTPKKALVTACVNALEALKLDFGAVDCCLDEDGNPWIIEVNTGPGLKGSSLEAWTSVFKEKIKELTKPKKTAVKKAVKTVGKKVTGAVTRKNPDKKKLVETMSTLADLIEAADDAEIAAIRSAAARMLGG